MALSISADIGGTFTDFVVHDSAEGTVSTFKILTSLPDRATALLAGVERATRNGRTPGDDAAEGYGQLVRFAHGSTVATNTLVEMNGAKLGLITTRGFRDLLELARQKRPHLYDLQADKPEPLVRRALRKEVSERVLADGTILAPLAAEEVEAAAAELRDAGIEAVAIVFLNSFANPAHELAAKAIVSQWFAPNTVFTSVEVLPQFREYERLSTTLVNAFVSPPIAKYLHELESVLKGRGASTTPLVMKSDAGVATISEATANAVGTIGSGPAGGVEGALAAAEAAGVREDLITFDMGGTSTDVSLVLSGAPVRTDQRTVAGWPIRGPAIDVESIGAGGGSVAWIDGGGLLRVGPRSAGSSPGPSSYGLGGTRPTITDANVVLGRIESLLGGTLSLRKDLAEAAITEHVAKPLGLSVVEAAHGILAVATAQMEQATRLITVQRGHDPRQFVLVAYGGAGAQHAPAVARNLGVGNVLIPNNAGVLSAQGILGASLSREFTVTRRVPLNRARITEVVDILGALKAKAEEWASGVQGATGRTTPVDDLHFGIKAAIDMRCVGQNYELDVAHPVEVTGESAVIDALTDSFHERHEQAYGYAFIGVPLECVTYRVRAEIHPVPLSEKGRSEPVSEKRATPVGERPVRWNLASGWLDTPIYAMLPPGAVIEQGPAIIEGTDTTITVWPGQKAEALPTGAVLITDLQEERGADA